MRYSKHKLINGLVLVIVLVTAFILFFYIQNRDEISLNIKKIKYESFYKKTEKEVDLINLVYVLQYTNDDDKKIYYSKELIDKVTYEGIQNSLYRDSYNESFSEQSPRDVFVLLYMVNLSDAGEYDLFSQEFSRYYVEIERPSRMDIIAMEKYGETNDIKIIDALITGYQKIIDNTDDDLLKQICEAHIETIKEGQGT
mgnify:CR=1 FL=1